MLTKTWKEEELKSVVARQCVNKREASGTVRLQGVEVETVHKFKYLGSTVQSI